MKCASGTARLDGVAHLGIRANAVRPGEINAVILSPGTECIVERMGGGCREAYCNFCLVVFEQE